MKDIKVKDLKVGDKIMFPNSRHPQEVVEIDREETLSPSVRLRADGVQWFVSEETTVRVSES